MYRSILILMVQHLVLLLKSDQKLVSMSVQAHRRGSIPWTPDTRD